jgi:hypothetical protein
MEDTPANNRAKKPQTTVKIPAERKPEKSHNTDAHPSYCMVTVLPMSANLRSSKIKKLYLSAIYRMQKHNEVRGNNNYFAPRRKRE